MTTIAVVEDDAAQRSVFVSALKKEGYKVVEATNAAEGFKIFHGEILPDCGVIDIIMPPPGVPVSAKFFDEEAGLKLIERLRADLHTSNVPLVILTSLKEDKDRLKGVQSGADQYLSKPADEGDIVVSVHRAMHIRGA